MHVPIKVCCTFMYVSSHHVRPKASETIYKGTILKYVVRLAFPVDDGYDTRMGDEQKYDNNIRGIKISVTVQVFELLLRHS